MSCIFHAEDFGNIRFSLFPIVVFYVFEAQKDDRILPLVFSVGLSAGPDQLIFEPYRIIFPGFFKKYPQHIHVKSLSETAGAGEQRHLGKCINEIPDQKSFINIVIVGYCFYITGNTNRQGATDTGFFRWNANRLGSFFRYEPGTTFFHSSFYFAGLAHLLDPPFRNIPLHGGIIYRNIGHIILLTVCVIICPNLLPESFREI